MSGCWSEEDKPQDSAPDLLVKLVSLKEYPNSRERFKVV
jgi:hypothetical protein